MRTRKTKQTAKAKAVPACVVEDRVQFAGMIKIKHEPIKPIPECDYGHDDKRPILMFKKLSEDAKIPEKVNPKAAGYDSSRLVRRTGSYYRT